LAQRKEELVLLPESRSFRLAREESVMRRINVIVACALILGLAVLAGMSQATSPDSAYGKVVAVYPDIGTLVVNDNSSQTDRTFQLDKNGRVLINEQPATLQDLMPGEYVAVVFEQLGDKLLASEVRCNRFGQ
jgi:hypothetical protein